MLRNIAIFGKDERSATQELHSIIKQVMENPLMEAITIVGNTALVHIDGFEVMYEAISIDEAEGLETTWQYAHIDKNITIEEFGKIVQSGFEPINFRGEVDYNIKMDDSMELY